MSWASLSAALALLTHVILSGCTVVGSSNLVDDYGRRACDVSVGGYYLPRRLVKLTLSEFPATANNNKKSVLLTIDDNSFEYVPDKTAKYCLNYYADWKAEDQLGIDRTEDGLLNRVHSKASDKSGEIALALIKGLAGADEAAASRAAKFRENGGAAVIGSYSFDPFDRETARNVNETLRHFGYCVYLDPANDPFVPEWSVSMCLPWVASVKQGGSLKDGSVAESISDRPTLNAQPIPRNLRRSIFYRANLTHTLVVLKRPEPNSPEPWAVDTVRRIEMPNAAPAFAIAVERSLFVDRETDLWFDHGVLTDVKIKKASELNAFFSLPLQAAQVIVAIPAQVAKIRINTANNQQALMNANAQLITTLRQQQDAVNASRIATAAAGTTSDVTPIGGGRSYSGEAYAGRSVRAANSQAVDKLVRDEIERVSTDQSKNAGVCQAVALQCLATIPVADVTPCINRGVSSAETRP